MIAKIILLSSLAIAFCTLNSSLFSPPDYFPEPTYNFDKNPLSKEKITLGSALFYDPILSKDLTISCASCHSPYNAFAHTDHDLSHGIKDQIGSRNAPALFNLAWQKSFMWDGAINHLDMQALAPISHPEEMGESIANVVQKLAKSPIYPKLFRAAYGDSSITGARTLKALSQFQLTLVSASSKYDQVQEQKDSFSLQEQAGYALFLQNCNSCHTEPLFSSYEFANNGLPVDTTLNDYGRIKISQKAKDSLLFKIPSLRNLSFSYPYMHDGRFKKLNEVLEHYTKGIKQSPTLAKVLKKPIALTAREKVDLIAFLLTLDDRKFVFDRNNKFPRDILLPSKGF